MWIFSIKNDQQMKKIRAVTISANHVFLIMMWNDESCTFSLLIARGTTRPQGYQVYQISWSYLERFPSYIPEQWISLFWLFVSMVLKNIENLLGWTTRYTSVQRLVKLSWTVWELQFKNADRSPPQKKKLPNLITPANCIER